MWHSVGFYRRRGMLRPLILRLLEQGPLSGMEVMDQIEKRSHRHHPWRPSPGSIYPRLKEMCDEGLIRKRPDGRYELTSTVRFGQRPMGHGTLRSVTEVLTEMEGLTDYVEDLRRADPGRATVDPARVARLVERWSRWGRFPPERT